MSGSDDLSRLAPPDIWDQFSRQFLRLNEDIQFGVAQDDAELEAVFRLRYATVIEKGWGQPADFPDSLECDVYDERAIQIVGRNREGAIIATGRVVLPTPGARLPTEDFFDLIIEPYQQVVDVGRGIVTTGNRSHQIFLGLMSQSWIEVRQRGYCEICATMTKSMLRLYRRMDIPLTVLGNSRPYWNEQRFPCKFDLEGTVQAYLAHHRNMLP